MAGPRNWRAGRAAHTLRRALQSLHYLIVLIVLIGWLGSDALWLKFYVFALPVMVLHWRLNGNRCILTDIEMWFIHSPETMPPKNQHEPFIARILRSFFKRDVSLTEANRWAYGCVTLAWLLGIFQLAQSGGW